jgi:hypothetical protein
MSDYYCDILDASDKRMDYDHESQFKQDPLKQLSFKTKSAPSKALSLSNATDMVKGKIEGSWDFKHKTELKHVCANNQYEMKITSSNKDFTLEMNAAPTNLNKDMNTSFHSEAKCTPQKSDWEVKMSAKVGGFKLGPVVPYSEVSHLNSL